MLLSISNIVIKGDNATSLFGSTYAHFLPIEQGGGIFVEADAKVVPEFGGPIKLYGLNSDIGNNVIHIRNDSLNGELKIYSFNIAPNIEVYNNFLTLSSLPQPLTFSLFTFTSYFR